jgi:hypothetical protein
MVSGDAADAADEWLSVHIATNRETEGQGRMTPASVLEYLIALQADHVEAHRRMVAALETNVLIGLVEASRR